MFSIGDKKIAGSDSGVRFIEAPIYYTRAHRLAFSHTYKYIASPMIQNN